MRLVVRPVITEDYSVVKTLHICICFKRTEDHTAYVSTTGCEYVTDFRMTEISQMTLVSELIPA